MKVILLTDVKKVGRRNDVVEVAQGFAENVLFPKKQAVPATREHLARHEATAKRVSDSKAFEATLLAKNIAELAGKEVRIRARANESGTLFQTVHAKQVVEAIHTMYALSLPESALGAFDAKQVGTYAVTLSGGGAKSQVRVVIAS